MTAGVDDLRVEAQVLRIDVSHMSPSCETKGHQYMRCGRPPADVGWAGPDPRPSHAKPPSVPAHRSPAPPPRRSGAGSPRTKPAWRRVRATGCQAPPQPASAAAAIPAPGGARSRTRPRPHGRRVPAVRPALHDQRRVTRGAAAPARTSAASCAAWCTAARWPSTSIRSRRSPSTTSCPGARRTRWARSGCPLRCKFCQNWQISQARPGDFDAAYMGPSADRRCGRPSRGAGRGVHLQRADRVHRVRPRHRGRGPAPRACAP